MCRQNVSNVQPDFTVLVWWMRTLAMCLVLPLRLCVLSDTIAHKVGNNNEAILTHS